LESKSWFLKANNLSIQREMSFLVGRCPQKPEALCFYHY